MSFPQTWNLRTWADCNWVWSVVTDQGYSRALQQEMRLSGCVVWFYFNYLNNKFSKCASLLKTTIRHSNTVSHTLTCTSRRPWTRAQRLRTLFKIKVVVMHTHACPFMHLELHPAMLWFHFAGKSMPAESWVASCLYSKVSQFRDAKATLPCASW